ncbi:MAG TPA: zf-HC2 domain-containing protein [Thermoanaerobaculia bacterium]|nr:zf-HC2 domain-containing protein [Thermoanaerobaculia bacterium]
MRELKYDEVGGSGSAHPELEEIAAYLDGRLSAAERRGITAHLSVCTECLELFTETAHALEETSAGTAGGEVVPFDRPLRSPRRWLPVAAAAAALLAAGLAGYRLLLAPPSVEVAELVEPLAGGRGAADAIWTGPVYRGGEDQPTEAFYAKSLLVGAHLVGFQTAAAAGDSRAAADAARRVANYLDENGFLPEETKKFRDAQLALGADRPGAASLDLARARALVSFARALVKETSEPIEDSFSEVHLPFGEWAQAGYVAARTGSREWFERRKNRRFLSYLLRLDEKDIDPEALEALERIREVWDRGELGPAELAALAGQFEAILQRYQALSEQDPLFSEE